MSDGTANSFKAERRGRVLERDGFSIFLDEDNYAPDVQRALRSGGYEGRERELVRKVIRPHDRVLEVGTALGMVTMTAAQIVGAENVATYDANAAIVADARENFQRNGLSGIHSHVGVLANKTRFHEGATVSFHISRSFWGSRLVLSPDSSDIVHTVQVPLLCLEQEIERYQATTLICDIEGGEVDLLTNADLRGVHRIIMETHYWSAGEVATDVMMRGLVASGFSPHLGLSGRHVTVLRRHDD